MRHTTRALVGGLLVACCCCQTAAADESRFRLWPFGGGRGDDAELTGNSLAATPPSITPGSAAALPPQVPSEQYMPETLPERRWMFQSPLAKVSWPRIHMPEVSFPRPHLPRPQLWPNKADADEARNAWVQKSPDPNRPSPLQAVQQGAQRVGQSTRSAWRRTVDVLTPGDSASSTEPRIAARAPQPPLWKRMFRAEQPPQQGPQTVTEWMAQERLNP